MRQQVKVDQAVWHDGQIGDFKSLFLQMAAGIQNTFVFGDAGHNMIFFALVKSGHALNGQVVGFGGARGENDVLGFGADEGGDLLSGDQGCLFGLPPIFMIAGMGIAKFFGKPRDHGLNHSGVARGRGLIIHINGSLAGGGGGERVNVIHTNV